MLRKGILLIMNKIKNIITYIIVCIIIFASFKMPEILFELKDYDIGVAVYDKAKEKGKIEGKKEGKIEVTGEPTEVAIVNQGLATQKDKNELDRLMPRVSEIPFDSNRKMMTTIHQIGNKYRVITKGAPDVLLERCHINTSEEKRQIQKENEKMAQKALRVIAVGYKDLDFLPQKIDTNTIENNLKFIGLIGMIDPPREGVKEAVRTCKKAGIKTVMITGDHIATAKAIAKELQILGTSDKAITGQELDKIPQKQLEKTITEYSVFARVTPEHKVRIVKAWQKTGAVVAMTGDGVIRIFLKQYNFYCQAILEKL